MSSEIEWLKEDVNNLQLRTEALKEIVSKLQKDLNDIKQAMPDGMRTQLRT